MQIVRRCLQLLDLTVLVWRRGKRMAFWRRRPRGLPATIYSETLLDAFVDEGSAEDAQSESLFGFEPPYSPKVLKFLWRFRAACVIYCCFRRTSDYEGQERLDLVHEKVLLRDVDFDRKSMAEFMSVAMTDIDLLVDSDGPPISWAREKIKELGRDESNPLELAEFCFFWLAIIAACGEAMEEISLGK